MILRLIQQEQEHILRQIIKQTNNTLRLIQHTNNKEHTLRLIQQTNNKARDDTKTNTHNTNNMIISK